MGLISYLRSRLTAWSRPVSQTPGVLWAPPSSAGVEVDADRAMSLSAVFAAVALLSRVIGSLPLAVYRREGRAKEHATTHPAYRLLHTSPNPEMTASSFRRALEWNRLLGGCGYAEVQWAGNGKPLALWPLEYWRVKPQWGEDYQLRYLIDGQRLVEGEDVLAVPLISGDGVVGKSFLDYAVESIGLGIAAQECAAKLFGNGARPGGVLSHPQVVPEKARGEMRRSWEERHGGPGNAGRTAILWGGWTYTPGDGTFAPEQSQLLESRRFTTEEVARWLGVPPHLLRDLQRATFCLPAGQTVLTEDGPTPIEDVRPGDMVWSRGDDGGRLRLARVQRAGCTGRDPILTISTTNRTIRCNVKHPILCRRKRVAPRTAGRGGAPSPDGLCEVTWETRYVPAGELAVGDTVVTLERLPDGGSLEACPTRLPSIGFMEFCGLLLGDGNVISSGGSRYVTIARAAHAPYMDYYREVILAEFRKNDGSPVHLQEGDRQTRFSSGVTVDELRALGLGGTARTKRVPGWVFRLPESHRLAFLRGFLDADGSCDRKGRLSFSSCNRAMLGQVRDLCIGCGVPVTNLRTQEGTTRLPGGGRKAFAQHCFTCSDPAASRRIGSRTPAYVARMEAGRPFGRKGRAYPRHGGGGFAEPGLGLARINRIDVGAPEPVYDLTVEGTHSFVAEGVVVHNSNIEQQNLDFLAYSLGPTLTDYEQEYDRKLLSPPDVYSKHNVTGLLRGDAAARSSYYTQLFQIGVLSVNDIRDLEDRNPVEGGDVHFVPLALAPLPKVANPPPVVPETPPPPAAAPAPTPAPAPAPSADGQAPALRGLLAAALGRLARVEANAARRAAEKPGRFLAWLDEFTPAHQARLSAALAPGLGEAAAGAAERWCGESRTRLLEVAGAATPAAFAAAVERELQAWSGRVNEAVEQAMGGLRCRE